MGIARRRSGAVFGMACMAAATCLTVLGGPPAGAAAGKSPIVIGYITSETGVASSNFSDGPGGAQARIDLQNAHGGVNGHPLKLVVEDDQSGVSSNQTAAEDLVSNKKAMVVIQYSALGFGSARYLQQQGIPVVGSAFDGPEWGQQPYSNMFSWAAVSTPFNGVYYTSDGLGKFLHAIGVTKYAGLGYGISPSSKDSIYAAMTSAAKYGIKQCYLNQSVPFGGSDFTADVLQIKSAGCNGVTGSFVDNSDLALSGAVKQGGIAAKQVYFTGYDENILSTAATRAAFEGSYAQSAVNFSPPGPAAKAMQATLKKYDPSYGGGIPDFGLFGSYISADLAIKGLQLAGKNPTSASFISHLRKLGSYNAGGILPSSVSFQHFGTVAMIPKTSCAYFEQLRGDHFVPYSGKAVCGKRISYNVP